MFTLNEGAIATVFLTACVLNVMGNDGWSKAYCPTELCIKYRVVEKKRFCSVDNFKASYRKTTPILVVFVLPQKDGKNCGIILNSITQSETKQVGRKYDVVNVNALKF